jgi:hypothetical protein
MARASLFGQPKESAKAQKTRNAKAPVLKADDGLAAEAAVAKLFEHLARAVQFNHGTDARSDRAVRERGQRFKGITFEPIPKKSFVDLY